MSLASNSNMRPSGRTRLGRCHCGAFLQDCSHGQSMLAQSVELERAFDARRRDSVGSYDGTSENTLHDPSGTAQTDLSHSSDNLKSAEINSQAEDASAAAEVALMPNSESHVAISAVADPVEGARESLGKNDRFNESCDSLGFDSSLRVDSAGVKSAVPSDSSFNEEAMPMSPSDSANEPEAKNFDHSPESPPVTINTRDSVDGGYHDGIDENQAMESGAEAPVEGLNAEGASTDECDEDDEDEDEEELKNCSYCGIRDYFSTRKEAVCEGCPVPLQASIEVGSLVTVSPRTWPGINKHGGDGRVTAVHRNTAGGDRADVVYYMGGKDRAVPARWVRSNDPNAVMEPRGVLGRCKRPDCPSLVLHCDHNQDPASWIPCAKPECRRDAVDCAQHSQEPWFWKLCVKPRCGCYAGECGHEQDPERWILCLREDCDAFQFDCEHDQDPSTWPAVPEIKNSRDKTELLRKARKQRNKQKARRSALVRGAGILAGETPADAKDVRVVSSKKHSPMKLAQTKTKGLPAGLDSGPAPPSGARKDKSDDSDADSLVENILRQKRSTHAFSDDDEDTDDELNFLRFNSKSSSSNLRGSPSLPSRAGSSSSRSPGSLSSAKLRELALDGYNSDDEDHNASDSDSNDENSGFLVAEGEENANATHDMSNRAKKRLRRWRSLNTPEQRSEKIASMHIFLENIGLPYLKEQVAAAKSLIDQHAKPIGISRYKFAAASNDDSEQFDNTDENSRRQGLREAAAMVESLKLFAIKVLRRDGLHLVDDMFRRTSLKNKDVIGLKNDNLGAGIQEEENKLKALGNRISDMGVDTDTDLSYSSDEGSLSSSAGYAPVNSPVRKSLRRQHAYQSDSSSNNSLTEIMGDLKRVGKQRPTTTRNLTSQVQHRKKATVANSKLSRAPPQQKMGEDSDSSIDDDAPLGDQRAKLLAPNAASRQSPRKQNRTESKGEGVPQSYRKPKQKRPRIAPLPERNAEYSSGSRYQTGSKIGVQDYIASDDESDSEDSMRDEIGTEATEHRARLSSPQLDNDDPDFDDFVESTVTNVAHPQMQSNSLGRNDINAPSRNKSKKHPRSSSGENRSERKAAAIKRAVGSSGGGIDEGCRSSSSLHGRRKSRRQRSHDGTSSRRSGMQRVRDGRNGRNSGGVHRQDGSYCTNAQTGAISVDTTTVDTAVNVVPKPVWDVLAVHNSLSSSWANGSGTSSVGLAWSSDGNFSSHGADFCLEGGWSDSALTEIERTFRRFGALEPLPEHSTAGSTGSQAGELPAQAAATVPVETKRAAILAKRLPTNGTRLLHALAGRLSARIRASMAAAALVRGKINTIRQSSYRMTAAARIQEVFVDAPSFQDLLLCAAFTATAPSPHTNLRIELVHAVGELLVGAEAGRGTLLAATSTRSKNAAASQARTRVVVPGCSGFFGLLWTDPWRAQGGTAPSTAARNEESVQDAPWGEAADDPLVMLHCFALDWLRPLPTEVAAAHATAAAGVASWSPSSANVRLCQEASRAHLSGLTKLLVAASSKPYGTPRRYSVSGSSFSLADDDPTLMRLWARTAVAARALESQGTFGGNDSRTPSLPAGASSSARTASVFEAPGTSIVASWRSGSFWGFLVDAFVDCYAHRLMPHVKAFLSKSPWLSALFPSREASPHTALSNESTGNALVVGTIGGSRGLCAGVTSRSSLLKDISKRRQPLDPLWSAALHVARAHAKNSNQSSSCNLSPNNQSSAPAQPVHCLSAPLLTFRSPFQPQFLWGASALVGPLLAASPLVLVQPSFASTSANGGSASTSGSSGDWAKQSTAWVRRSHPSKRTGPNAHAQCTEIVNHLEALTALGCPAIGPLAASDTAAKSASTGSGRPGFAATATSTSSSFDAANSADVAAATSDHALAQLWAAGLRVNAHALLVQGRHRKSTAACLPGRKNFIAGIDYQVADDGVDSEVDPMEDSSEIEHNESEAPRKARLLWSMTPGARTAASSAAVKEQIQGASPSSGLASTSLPSSSLPSSSSLALGDKHRLAAHATHFYAAVNIAVAAAAESHSDRPATSTTSSPPTIIPPQSLKDHQKRSAAYLSAVDALLDVSAAALVPSSSAWPCRKLPLQSTPLSTPATARSTTSDGPSDQSVASFSGLAIVLGALPLTSGLRQPLSRAAAESAASPHLPQTTRGVNNWNSHSSSHNSSRSSSSTADRPTAVDSSHGDVLYLSGPRAAAQALVLSLCRLTCRNLAMSAGLGRKRLAGQLFNGFERLELAMAEESAHDSPSARASNGLTGEFSQHHGHMRRWAFSGAHLGTQHALSHAAAAWTVAAASEGLLGDLGSDAKAADVAAAFVLRSARFSSSTTATTTTTSSGAATARPPEVRAGGSNETTNGGRFNSSSSSGDASANSSWSETEAKVYACATAANATVAVSVLTLVHFAKVSDDADCAYQTRTQTTPAASTSRPSSPTSPSPGALAVSSKLSAHFATALDSLIDAASTAYRLHTHPAPTSAPASTSAQAQLQTEISAAAVSFASVGATSALVVLKTMRNEFAPTRWRAVLAPAAFKLLELALRPDMLSNASHHGSNFLKLCLRLVAACAPQCTQSHGPQNLIATSTPQSAAVPETQSSVSSLSAAEAEAMAAYATAVTKQLPSLRRLVQMAWTPAGLDLTALQLPGTQAHQALPGQGISGGTAIRPRAVIAPMRMQKQPPAHLPNARVQPHVLPPSSNAPPPIARQPPPPQPVRRRGGAFGAQTTSASIPVRKGANVGVGIFIPRAPAAAASAANESSTRLQAAPAGGLAAAFPNLARPDILASAATAASAHRLPTGANDVRAGNGVGSGRAIHPPPLRQGGYGSGASSSLSRNNSTGSSSSSSTYGRNNSTGSSSNPRADMNPLAYRVQATMVEPSTETIRRRRLAEISAVSECAVELLEVYAALAAAHLCAASAARAVNNTPATGEAFKAFGTVCDDIAALRHFSSSKSSSSLKSNVARLDVESGSSEASAWARARLAGPVWACMVAERYPAILRSLVLPMSSAGHPLTLPTAEAATGATRATATTVPGVPSEAWPLLSLWLCAVTELRTHLAPLVAAKLDSPHHLHTATAAADHAAASAAAQSALMAALGGRTASWTLSRTTHLDHTFGKDSNAPAGGDFGIDGANEAASTVLRRGLPYISALALDLLGAGSVQTPFFRGSDAQAFEREGAAEIRGTLLLVRAAQSPPPPSSSSSSSSTSVVAQRFSAEGMFRAALRNLDTAITESRTLAALPDSLLHLSSASSRANTASGGAAASPASATAFLRKDDWVPVFSQVVRSCFALQAALLAAAAAPPPSSTSTSPSTATFAHVTGPAAHPARSMAVSILLPRYLAPLLKAATVEYWNAVAKGLQQEGELTANGAATAATSANGNNAPSNTVGTSAQNNGVGAGHRTSVQPGGGVAELCALPPLHLCPSSNSSTGDHSVRRLLLVHGLGSGYYKKNEEASHSLLLTSFVALLAQLNFSQGDAKAQLGMFLNAAVAERAADKTVHAGHPPQLANSNGSGLNRSATLDKTLVEGLPNSGLCAALTGATSPGIAASTAAGAATPITTALFPSTATSSSRLRLLRQHARSMFTSRLSDLTADANTQSFTSSSTAIDLQTAELAALRSLVADLNNTPS